LGSIRAVASGVFVHERVAVGDGVSVGDGVAVCVSVIVGGDVGADGGAKVEQETITVLTRKIKVSWLFIKSSTMLGIVALRFIIVQIDYPGG
jgi:hypothetical protein